MNTEETRDTAAMGITCGLISEELMRLGSGRDPELAFVSAALRNFGRMTMTSFMASDYRQARAIYSKHLASHPQNLLAWAKLARLGVFRAFPRLREACFR